MSSNESTASYFIPAVTQSIAFLSKKRLILLSNTHETLKNLICKFGFIIIALFMYCTLSAQEYSQYVIDSLSAEAKNSTGEYKLNILAKLIDLEFFSTNVLARLDDLEQEAKAQGSDRFLLFVYNSKMTYYQRNNNRDSISRYNKLSAPIVKELDPTDSFATRNEFLKIIDYTSRGLFDLALISQKKYLAKIENIGNVKPDIFRQIYIGIGDTYYYQEKYDEALKYFEQAKNLMQTVDNSPRSISILCLIALCHVNLENYAAAIEHCDLASSILNNEKGMTTQSSNYLKFLVNLIAIQAYSKSEDFQKAKALIDQLPGDTDTSYFQGQDDYYYQTLSVYYTSIKKYSKALEYNELVMVHLKKNEKILDQPASIKEKASLLYDMQNYKEAYDQLLSATQFTDSIRSSYSTILLDELAIIYEVDLKDAEISKANTRLRFTQAVITALFIISILLLVILLVIRVNSKKQLAKNKALFKQQEELRRSISHYEKMIVGSVNSNSPNVNPLFQKLEEYVIEEEIYKNPEISREDIAAVLNTNRQYLSAAIKEETGLTFTSYINKYRLEDARKQLLENDEVVIDDIILESGFSSRPTFHRLFKEQYGMAPHELKRAAIALQGEIIDREKDIL